MSELLPCPFCGSTNIDPEGWMSCEPDGSDKKTGPACDDCAGSTESVERWNTRDSVQAPSDTLVWIKDVVDLYFAPWGAAKAARFEDLTGDRPFDGENVLQLIQERLARSSTGSDTP